MGYSTHFCVSLTTLEAMLIYSAIRTSTNGQQMVSYLSLKNSNPVNWLLRFRNCCLNSLHCTVPAMATPGSGGVRMNGLMEVLSKLRLRTLYETLMA